MGPCCIRVCVRISPVSAQRSWQCGTRQSLEGCCSLFQLAHIDAFCQEPHHQGHHCDKHREEEHVGRVLWCEHEQKVLRHEPETSKRKKKAEDSWKIARSEYQVSTEQRSDAVERHEYAGAHCVNLQGQQGKRVSLIRR